MVRLIQGTPERPFQRRLVAIAVIASGYAMTMSRARPEPVTPS